MRVTGPEDAPVRRRRHADGLRVRVLAGPEPMLSSRAGLVEIDIAPGKSLPAHGHGSAEALVYVVSGRARFLSGESSTEVPGGGVVQLPQGTQVTITNSGVDTLRLLAVFSPAGFERVFLGWDSAPGKGAGASDEPRALLDLTGLPRLQRHRAVIAALEALESGTPLVIVNDHEPNALRRQLERRYGPHLGWEVRERSGDRVAAAIWVDDPREPDLESSAEGVLRGDLSPAAA
jgi:uncharacterized protein (DUF2249 family)/quercetin dioxygenase-like cupin family protein